MFEDWPVTMDPPPRAVVDPPQPVLVDLSRLLDNRDDAFRRDGVSMGVKAEGLEFFDQVPGHLHAWARSTSLHLSTGQMRSGTTLQNTNADYLACPRRQSQRDDARGSTSICDTRCETVLPQLKCGHVR